MVHRHGRANGFKPKRVKTRVGELELAVPQVRGAQFYPSALEKGCRSEKALRLALAEMYVPGVSTAKVSKITEELCGCEVSSSEVSRVARELDEELQAWRTRPLGEFKYLILNARYEKIRQGGCPLAPLRAPLRKAVAGDARWTAALGDVKFTWQPPTPGLRRLGRSLAQ